MKTLGERIRELREHKDLSLRELAKAVGTSAAFLSDVELGRRHPSPPVLKDLAKRLGTTEKELGQFDRRPPIKDLQRRAAANPAYGVMLRRVLEDDDPESVIKFLESRNRKKT